MRNSAPDDNDDDDDDDGTQTGPNARLIVLLVVLLSLVANVALFARPVARSVKAWQARRLADEAQGLAERGNYPAAFVKLRDASQIAPTEPRVTRLIAELLVQSTPPGPATVAAWRRVLEVGPDESAQLELLMAERLGGGSAEGAQQALQKLTPKARESALGRLAQAMLAAQRSDRASALDHFRAAAALAPEDRRIRFQLASYLLGDPVSGGEAEALELLKGLRQHPAAASAAHLLLRETYRRRGDFDLARAEAEALVQAPGARPEAWIALLGIDQAQGDAARVKATLSRLEKESKTDPGLLAALLAWSCATGDLPGASQILERQTDDALSSAPLLDSALEALEKTGQTARLRTIARRGEWGDRAAEAEAWKVRLAALEAGSVRNIQAWERVVELGAGDPAVLQRLLSLTLRWEWLREREKILQQLSLQPKPAEAMVQAWWQANVALRSTRGIFSSTRRLLEMGQNAPAVRNDFAATALLLGQEEGRAHRIALENFQLQPGNVFYRCTYAASLRIQGRGAEALALLGAEAAPALQFERLRVLVALGRRGEADSIAPRVPREQLLPEQEDWLRRFQAGASGQ